MKLIKILTGIFLLISMSSLAQQPAKDTLLRYYQKYPQEALKEAANLYQKGIKNHNTLLLIKSLMMKTTFDLRIDQDRYPQILQELEKYILQEKDVAAQSILHSYLAELYYQYYSNNRYQIAQRTDIKEYRPDNIKEWSSNIFKEKFFGHIYASIAESGLLQKKPISAYKEILITGNDSKTLRPTLYDFLCYRGIDLTDGAYFFKEGNIPELSGDILGNAQLFTEITLPERPDQAKISTLKIWQDLLKFRLKSNNIPALIMADLGRLENARQISQAADKDSLYIASLHQMYQDYKGNPILVEVMAAEAQAWLYETRIIPLNGKQERNRDLLRRKEKALSICEQGIRLYPGYKRINRLQQIIEDIKNPGLDVQFQNNIYPGEKLALHISSQNLSYVTVILYRINAPTVVYDSLSLRHGERIPKTLITEKRIPLKSSLIYTDTTFKLTVPESGLYEISIQNPVSKQKKSNYFICSQLFCSMQPQTLNQTSFRVMDWISGEAIPNAKILIYENKLSQKILKDSIYTDHQGLASLRPETGFRLAYEVVNVKNPNGEIYNAYTVFPFDKSSQYIGIITDRNIYRSGQTVYFKAIAVMRTTDSLYTLNKKNYVVYFRDPYGKEIARQTFTTNTFGSFTGQFVIPTPGLNGSYYIETGNERTYFKVADYKRPEFEITFSESKQNYHPGDTIRIKGQVKSFSGIKVANNPIEYEVKSFSPYRSLAGNGNLFKGISRTNANGGFELSFKADSNYPENYRRNIVFYNVLVKITDPKGETQEGNYTVTVYPNQPQPNIQMEKQINKEQTVYFNISLEGLAPDEQAQRIKYSIARLKPLRDFIKNDQFNDTIPEKTILTQEIQIQGQDSVKADLKNQPSGAYLLTVSANGTEKKQIFYLYSPRDKQPPIKTYNWIVKEKTDCYAGDTARIVFGTSVSGAHILYEVANADKIILKKFLTLSNENMAFEIPYKAEYGEKIWVTFSYVKNKQFINQTIPVTRIRDQKLIIETRVFRDKLTPGQKEQWKLRVTDEKGKPVTAEVLAMMYDASLDKLSPYNINFRPTYITAHLQSNWRAPFSFGDEKTLPFYFNSMPWKKYPVPPLRFDRFINWLPVGEAVEENRVSYYAEEVGEEYTEVYFKGNGNGMASRSFSKAILADSDAPFLSTQEAPLTVTNFRQNLSETAFFYPQLTTDSLGYINIDFTIPESTTRWKFTALATTPKLAVGKLVRMVTTSKTLMVRPNLPRFFRSGDQAEVKVTISNLSDTSQQGKARLELLLPGNEKIIYSQATDFSTSAQGNQTVKFNFKVPGNTDLLICRISAASNHYSDGEQQMVAVLPAEVLLTETLPIFTHQAGTHSYTLKSQSPSGRDYRLTLEFTENPIWYAVLALPNLTEAKDKNSADLSAAYYVNTIAARIARSNPKIVEAIRNWTGSKDGNTNLLSQLEQNSELKSILLSSTPWALQAQNETGQMQNLSQLFDPNRLSYLQNKALEELRQLQTQEGGWSWFNGMYPSRFMTCNVLDILSRSSLIGEKELGSQYKLMEMNGLKFLDKEMIKDYKNHLREIGYDQILYLYTRSLYRAIPLGETLDAHKYFMNLAQEQWGNYSFYEKSKLAIAFYNYGFEAKAREVLESLRQFAVQTPDQGMYWPNNRNYFYRNSAVQIHTSIMEAFYKIEGNTPELDQMKIWLLRQKQTQNWGNVPSTVDAIYALLLTGSDQLNNENKLTIQVGKHKYSTATAHNPLGYIKESFSAGEIKPNMKTVKVTKTNDAPSWGGLYLQYFEKLDQVKQHQTEISVEKKLYTLQINPDGTRELLPITQQPLKTGDKVIIRLTFSLDRDMDFLHLQDLRAACFEPVQQISGLHWQFGSAYYEDIKDAVTNFFFNSLNKGTYVIEYPVWVNQAGTYQDGIATFQSMYTPEYNAYSSGPEIVVEE